MLIVNYAHRLPANHDLGSIRQRSKERGTVWYKVPDLYFKAFPLREAGRFGVITNKFSSPYLGQHHKAFSNWLLRVLRGGYKIVTDSFGRADIEKFFALDAFRGKGREARFFYRDDISIPLDADLTDAFAQEIEWPRDYATRPDAIAVTVGLDPRNWKFLPVLLSESEPEAGAPGVAYQIAHLSRPLLDTLPQGGTR